MYYHVRISVKGYPDEVIRLDLSESELDEKILTPLNRDGSIIIQGISVTPNNIEDIKISRTKDKSDTIMSSYEFEMHKGALVGTFSDRWLVVEQGEDVTKEFLLNLTVQDKVSPEPIQKKENVDNRKVFVVHGRDERLRKSIFDFLTALRLDPIEWPEAVHATGEGTPYVGKVLRIINSAQAIVVLLTPDDLAHLREELWKKNEPEFEKMLSGQPRPNVLIELGMALSINEPGTIIIQVGEIKEISDIKGRHILRLDNTAAAKNQFVQRLKTAGCEVKTIGDDWLEAGDFTPPVLSPAVTAREELDDYPPDELEVNLMVVIATFFDGGRTVHELSINFSNGKQKLTLILNRLERHGFIECDKSNFNRWGAYYLTEKGREFLDAKKLL